MIVLASMLAEIIRIMKWNIASGVKQYNLNNNDKAPILAVMAGVGAFFLDE
jgi:hypothetical protein